MNNLVVVPRHEELTFRTNAIIYYLPKKLIGRKLMLYNW
jgi:hypothetical protein